MSTVCHPPADILLDPSDWYIANWRNLPPLARPAPGRFAPADCCARLARVKAIRNGWDCSAARIGPSLGPEEGRFWLEAFDRASPGAPPARIAEQLSQPGSLPRLSRDDCIHRLTGLTAVPAPEFVPALASQFDAATLIEIMLAPWKGNVSGENPMINDRPWRTGCLLLDGFRRFVRPWLTAEELESSRQVVRDLLAERPARERHSPPADFVVSLAASLGMSDEVDAALSHWEPAYRFQQAPEALNDRHFAVFGLADPARVIPGLQRLNLNLCEERHVRGLLAHLEAKAVPFVQDAVLTCSKRPVAELLTVPLGLVRRTETARVMLALTQRSRGPAPAQRWLDENRELAVPGLLPLIGEPALGEAALNYLRKQVRAGRQDLIDQHLEPFDADTAARVRRGLETTAAMQVVDEVAVPLWFPMERGRKPRLPSWLDPAALPSLRIDGKRLPAAETAVLLSLLRDRPLENPHELFAQLKKQADPRLLDAFVWAVFERWHSASGDPKDKWALTALGHLGGDGVCLQLAALIAEWPGKSQHSRANLGLQCLEAIGTPLALLCIHRLAQTSTYAVGVDARLWIEQLTRMRRLTLEQFEDRIVPDLGLDGDGCRRLEYSGRTYRLTLGPDRQARLLDPKRQYLSELPELSENDDPAAVESARAEWNLFKLQTREVMQIQTARLENAMLRWRRWKAPDFEQYIVRHPLLSHLARALLWGVFETVSKLGSAFRATEGRTCVDAAGSLIRLEADCLVGVVHPVLLPPEERMIWRDVLSEQGLSLPEWQMARAVHILQEGEKKQQELSRWRGRTLDYFTLNGASRRLGYHGGAESRSHLCCRVQYFPAVNVTVYLLHTPIPADGRYEAQHQQIELTGCQFRAGDTRTRVPNVNQALPLGEVDMVLVDEVISGMDELMRTAPRG